MCVFTHSYNDDSDDDDDDSDDDDDDEEEKEERDRAEEADEGGVLWRALLEVGRESLPRPETHHRAHQLLLPDNFWHRARFPNSVHPGKCGRRSRASRRNALARMHATRENAWNSVLRVYGPLFVWDERRRGEYS